MSPETSQSIPMAAMEPQASRRPVPVLFFVLLFVLLWWGMYYFDQHGGWFSPQVYSPYTSDELVTYYQPPSMGSEKLALGRKKYEEVCALCHNPDGMGKPNQAPQFVGSEWVLGSPERLLRIPLFGLSGQISVVGKPMTFPAPMPAMGVTMSEEELSAVLTYMRQSWGNKASEITAEQIKKVKADVGAHPNPFTPEELGK